MARRSFIPGAIGILNAAKYEAARDGTVDLDGLYNKDENIESNFLEQKDKKKSE